MGSRRGRSLLAVTAGVVVPLAVATGWIPLRVHHPTVDVALALVAVVTALGVSRRRPAVTVGAVVAGLGFAYFDTRPFDRFAVSKSSDLATAVMLVVVGAITGELALRVARQRDPAAGDLAWIRGAASQLASGEELVVMLASVADELTRLLGLAACTFDADPVPPDRACVARDGAIESPAGGGVVVGLPVWGQGHQLGHFALRPTPGVPLPRHQLLVAVTIADQVGAALFAQAPPIPGAAERPAPTPHLRVIP